MYQILEDGEKEKVHYLGICPKCQEEENEYQKKHPVLTTPASRNTRRGK